MQTSLLASTAYYSTAPQALTPSATKVRAAAGQSHLAPQLSATRPVMNANSSASNKLAPKTISQRDHGAHYSEFKSQLINVKIKSPNTLQQLFYAPDQDQFWLAIRCNSKPCDLIAHDYDEVLLSLSNDAAYALAAAD